MTSHARAHGRSASAAGQQEDPTSARPVQRMPAVVRGPQYFEKLRQCPQALCQCLEHTQPDFGLCRPVAADADGRSQTAIHRQVSPKPHGRSSRDPKTRNQPLAFSQVFNRLRTKLRSIHRSSRSLHAAFWERSAGTEAANSLLSPLRSSGCKQSSQTATPRLVAPRRLRARSSNECADSPPVVHPQPVPTTVLQERRERYLFTVA